MSLLNTIFFFFEKILLFLIFLLIGVLIYVVLNSSIFWFSLHEFIFFYKFLDTFFLSFIQYIGILIILLIYYFLFKNLFIYSIQYYITHFFFSWKLNLFDRFNNRRIDEVLKHLIPVETWK